MKQSYIVCAVGIAVLFGLLMAICESGAANTYIKGILMTCCIAVIMTTSLNLTVGVLGQLTLGCCGFEMIGAYSAALLSKLIVAKGIAMDPTARFLLTIFVGAVIACIFGILVGIPALRLHGDYLAIITLGFGEIIRVVINNLKFTGGAFGLSGIQKHTSISWAFWVMVISLFVIHTLIKSRQGRAILSIRENEIAAECSGIPTTYYKTLAFTVSAFFAGVAGGLYAHYLCILDPSNFGFNKSIDILIMVVLGGLGSMLGSVISTVFLTLLPEVLRNMADYRMVVYALLLVIVMIFKPSGLCGKYDFSMTRFILGIKNFSFKKAFSELREGVKSLPGKLKKRFKREKGVRN